MDKIIDILDSIAYEKGLKIEDVENALKESLVKTAEKMVDYTLIFDAEIDRVNKKLKLFQKIEVVSKDDKRLDENAVDEYDNILNKENYIILEDALEISDNLEIGDFMHYDLEFENMGRNAATILHNNFEYKLQRFLEGNLLSKYQNKIGHTISGRVTRIDKDDNTFVEIGEVKGLLLRKNRIKGEYFKIGDTVKAVVRTVGINKNYGLIVEISRTSPKFLESLLRLEVLELKDDILTIEACARIPGSRAKIAMSSSDINVDPIGSVVGVKGVRITAVSKQLNGENIDCVEYSPIPEMFISRALSPALILSVKVERPIQGNERGKAIVTINSDQKSKAIGKAGLNIRLASMLTKFDIQLEEVDSPSLDANGEVIEKQTDTASLEALFK